MTEAIPGPTLRRPGRLPHHRPGLCVFLGLVVAASSSGMCADSGPTGDHPILPLRVAFSSRMFVEVNEGDARAAIKVWGQTMGRERGIPVDADTRILTGADAIAAALRRAQIDVVTMTAEEYWTIRHEVPLGPFIVGVKSGRSTEQYILVVRRDSGIGDLGDLRGRNLIVHLGPRASLAPVWLETRLLQGGFGRTAAFFGRVQEIAKLARAVLPVFFRQADACLVTRDGFETMSELNPQVGQELTILAESPPFVPAVFCFRGNLDSPYRDKLLSSVRELPASSAGRQTMILFGTDNLTACPASAMDSACELLDLHERLCAAAVSAAAVSPAPAEDGAQAKGNR